MSSDKYADIVQLFVDYAKYEVDYLCIIQINGYNGYTSSAEPN